MEAKWITLGDFDPETKELGMHWIYFCEEIKISYFENGRFYPDLDSNRYYPLKNITHVMPLVKPDPPETPHGS